MNRKSYYIAAGLAAALVAGVAWQVKAADLGGNCCVDLEERIADLESSAARKGNRKVTLQISGQVSKALLWHDADGMSGENSLRAIDNSNSGTRFRFRGDGKVSQSFSVGFLIELGVDESKGRGLRDAFPADDLALRHSAVWINTALGKVTLGHTSSATDGIAEIDVSDSNIASLPMSAEPLWTFAGAPAFAGFSLNPAPFDGGRSQIVGVELPTVAGFTASAAWGGGQTGSYDDLWDAALRYAGEHGGFRVAGGIGYRVESLSGFVLPDVKTVVGSASVMHRLSGLFLTASAGRQDDNPVYGDLEMWQVRGGIARVLNPIGRTTFFAEYGDHKVKGVNVSSSFVGGGIVQAIDGVAMHIGISVRAYDVGGGVGAIGDVTTGMLFARIQF